MEPNRVDRGEASMGRVVLPLTVDRLGDLTGSCADCVFWELGPALVRRSRARARDQKEGWLTATLLEWGSPGRVVYVDDRCAGYIMYAPARLVPRALAFPTAPVSSDAIVLVTARIDPEFAGQGLGRVLVQTAAKDILRRGARALEAYGSTDGHTACLLPADFLGAVGFRTAREHSTYPRMRLDLRTALRWRGEVEQAVERLLAPVRGLAPQPVGTAHRDDPTSDRPV
jgi:GNAT superfamily N-acetyltransferase